jgi:hypothetical protein
MSEVTCQGVRTKDPDETVNVLVSFVDLLDKDDSIDETISSITSVTATGLTISGALVTTTLRKYNDGQNSHSVPAGKGITFTVVGGTAGDDYAIKCKVVTSGGQTRVRYATMQVRTS